MARTEPEPRPELEEPRALERLILERRLSRRHFLGGAALGAASLALAACAPKGAASPSAGATPGANLGDTLNLATWPVTADQPRAFTDLTKVAVNIWSTAPPRDG
jgi:hypothetical protein